MSEERRLAALQRVVETLEDRPERCVIVILGESDEHLAEAWRDIEIAAALEDVRLVDVSASSLDPTRAYAQGGPVVVHGLGRAAPSRRVEALRALNLGRDLVRESGVQLVLLIPEAHREALAMHCPDLLHWQDALVTVPPEGVPEGDADGPWDAAVLSAAEDRHMVRALVQRLRGAGFRIWLAEERLRPGTPTRAAIARDVAQSRWLLVALTPGWLASGATHAGLAAALTRPDDHARLLPVRLDDVDEAAVTGVLAGLTRHRVDTPRGLARLVATLRGEPRRATWDAFLCYASADLAAVKHIDDTLREAGLHVWWDRREVRPGEVIVQAIQAGLARSRWLLLCLSDAMLASPWCGAEAHAALHLAVQGGPNVVPVVVGDLDDTAVPPFVDMRRRVDGRTADGLAELLAAIQQSPTPLRLEAPAALELVERRLFVHQNEDGFEGQWLLDGHVAQVRIEPPLAGEHAEEHRWYLEQYLRYPGVGDRGRAAGMERRLKAWGEALHDGLAVEGGPHPLELCELLTIISSSPEALALPWELVRDGQGPRTPRDLVLRRQLPSPVAPAEPELGLPLRVLMVVARPIDIGFVDPRSSVGPVLDALDPLGGQVRVTFCEPPTWAEARRRLSQARRRGEPFHVLHFDGHGVYLEHLAGGVGALCFEDEARKNELIPGPELGDALAEAGLALAVLEACQTSDVRDSVFGAVAPALLQRGIGSVLAFSHAVTVAGARVLVGAFYEAVAAGQTVGQAVLAGRRAMADRPARLDPGGGEDPVTLEDWHLPQLYQAGPDPVLVPGGASLPRGPGRAHQRGKAPSASVEALKPLHGFHGRAHTLLELRRSLEAAGAVVVCGGGGMGKTALACEAARWWARTGHRRDGTVLTSFEDRKSPQVVVRELLRYVDGLEWAPAPEDDERARAIRLFRERDLCWVWDNFESILPPFAAAAEGYPDEHRRELLQLFEALTRPEGGRTPKGWLIVTCRPVETGLTAVRTLELGGLRRPDALEMTTRIMTAQGVTPGARGYERDAVERLLDALADHPLSLELVLPHLRDLRPERIRRDFRKLLARFKRDAAVEPRNRGLMASLEFSTSRLSDAARAALPWLAWFEGGAFEANVLMFTGMDPEAWEAVREELESVALVRLEQIEGLEVGGRGWLAFHPTLRFARSPDDVADPSAAQRFVAVYAALANEIDGVLNGASPAAGMAVARREEGNLRSGAAWAQTQGDGDRAWLIGNTVSRYLKQTGRVLDRAHWAARLSDLVGGGDLEWEHLAAEREHAWALLTKGHTKDAIAVLEAQLTRLEAADADYVARARALTLLVLGRVRLEGARPDLALEPISRAAGLFEALGDEENLAAALGDCSTALSDLGRHAEALDYAERGLTLALARGASRNAAAAYGQVAQILAAEGRHAEANQQFDRALDQARTAGDVGLEARILGSAGSLADDRGQLDRAGSLYRQALGKFVALRDEAGEMRAADLLGVLEARRGQHDAAEAWHERARALAEARGDLGQLARTAANLGILSLFRAERLATEESERLAELRRARAELENSLRISRELHSDVGVAATLSQLGEIHRLLGDPQIAEQHVHEALAIHESLGLPDVWKNYAQLESIAEAQQDLDAADRWRAMKEAKLAELQRPADGEHVAFLALAQEAFQHRQSEGSLPPQLRDAFAQLREQDPPLPAVADFLEAVALGTDPLPQLPADLPAGLHDILVELVRPVDGR